MKVFRIDTADGEYYTLTEKELHEYFTDKELEQFRNDDETFFYETKYTVKQLQKARQLRRSESYCYKFEQDHNISPSVYDILKLKYN